MAPDKIFAGVAAGHLYASRTPIKLFGEKLPEYIRKDALLEWAKEHQEGERQGSYTWSCYQIILDKLNSM